MERTAPQVYRPTPGSRPKTSGSRGRAHMGSNEGIRADFERLVKRPEARFDLARAALLIAAEADPNVDVDGEIHTIESWAARLREQLDPNWNNLQKLARLRNFLYEE